MKPLYDSYLEILDASAESFKENSDYNTEVEFEVIINFAKEEIKKYSKTVLEKLKANREISSRMGERANREIMKNIINNLLQKIFEDYFEHDSKTLREDIIPFLRDNTAILFVGNGVSKEVHEININELAGQILEQISINDEDWKRIKEDPEKDRKFKNKFISLCNNVDKEKIYNSPSHKIIAILFVAKFLKHIVTFNWDAFIEESYRAVTGKEIDKIIYNVTSDSTIYSNKSYLWKMHGDIDFPGEEWIYPNEKGKLHPKFVEEIEKFPGIFLIVGYSEEEKFKEFLVQNLGTRQYVIRGREYAETQDDYYRKREIIHLTAKAFFEIIKEYFNREEPLFKEWWDKSS